MTTPHPHEDAADSAAQDAAQDAAGQAHQEAAPGTVEPQEDTEVHPVPGAYRLDVPAATPTTPTPTAVEAPPAKQRGARMGTVVWGMLLAAFGAAIVARGLGVTFDVELALIVLLCVMGGALLLGSVVAVIRRG